MREMRRLRLKADYDIAVVGSGFAGSLTAMIARRLGRSVVLLERGTHPRVVIGESSTPLSNLLLEELAARYELPALRPLAKWGSWQRTYPGIACGLKRGFTFHHQLGLEDAADPRRQDQLLVAASPRDAIADTHWYRADFDAFLVEEARKLGADYVDRVALRGFTENGREALVTGTRDGHEIEFRAKFVVDATGPRGFLHRALDLGERELPGLPATQALYSHFTGVRRLAETTFHRTGGAQPPYPIDDAAVHHVFDGGWVWVLRFGNGITSAGVAATDRVAAELGLPEGEAAWQKLLKRIPALQHQFAEAKTERAFTHLPRLSFRSGQAAGARWAMLPSAAGFVDPLLSTGFPLALLGVSRLGEILSSSWESAEFEGAIREYAAQTDRELVATGRLIGALYASMNNFPVFVALTLLYFAAASYAEAARRLGKEHLASSFLLCDDPEFGPECARLCERARLPMTKAESAALIREIVTAIEPFNVAGLGRAERRNWYPVVAEDLLHNAHKLQATREEILAMLERCGFGLGDGA